MFRRNRHHSSCHEEIVSSRSKLGLQRKCSDSIIHRDYHRCSGIKEGSMVISDTQTSTASYDDAGGNRHRYRLVVLGAAEVGKTALVTRFLYRNYSGKYRRTVEELYREELEASSGSHFTLDLLDTSGAFSFPAMRRLAIQSAHGIMLVYSIDNSSSFQQLLQIRNEIMEIRGSSLPVIVLGNKADRDLAREVSKEEADDIIIRQWGYGFLEVSAKDDILVSNGFEELLVRADLAFSEDGDTTDRFSIKMADTISEVNSNKSLEEVKIGPTTDKDATLINNKFTNLEEIQQEASDGEKCTSVRPTLKKSKKKKCICLMI